MKNLTGTVIKRVLTFFLLVLLVINLYFLLVKIEKKRHLEKIEAWEERSELSECEKEWAREFVELSKRGI